MANLLKALGAAGAAYGLSRLTEKKPDGTPIGFDIRVPTLPRGVASVITNGINPGAILDTKNIGNLLQDPNKNSILSSILSFSSAKPPAGGPPYENVLEQFASYAPVWTLACLTPEQFNDPKTYRGNPSALQEVIFASAGRFDAQRSRTAYGAPEYFVDNIVMNSKLSPGPGQGNTNVIGFSFDVYEPYSLGLFIQSLQSAAIRSGYPNYFNECPFLLKLEFLGFKDDGAIFTGSEALAKYFTIKITKVEFTVNEGGSSYKVQAAPLHHTGFGDVVNRAPTDITITGETVKEMLVSGQRSLCTVLNRTQLELVNKEQQDYPDLYEIVFPVDSHDEVGLSQGENVELLKATADPKAEVKQPVSGRQGQESLDFGDGAIGAAGMGFGPESGGNYLYPLEGETADPATGQIVRDQMIIDPKQRAFMFKQDDKITEIIMRVVIASEYGVDAVKAENLDAEGRASWFRIDCQMQFLDFDTKRNVRSKKYIFRVIPYKVRGDILKNPSSTSAGAANLKKKIAKRYNYLYTGQNNDLLKFDLTFNGMFFTGQLPRPATENSQISNKDLQNAAPSNGSTANIKTGVAPEATTSTTGSPSVKPDHTIDVSSSSGEKNVGQMVADAFQQAFLNSSKDLVNIEVDILGDPYYISDSGLSANYVAGEGPIDTINSDGSMNWEGGEVYAEIVFRNPVEPNLGTTGQGGLFNFPEGPGVSPFSGTYMVHEVTNKFSSGTFQQSLKMVRQQGQPEDAPGAPISRQEQALYDTTNEEPEKTAPAEDPSLGQTFDAESGNISA